MIKCLFVDFFIFFVFFEGLDFVFEDMVWCEGFKFVVGVDEVGCGFLVGLVVVVVVIFYDR